MKCQHCEQSLIYSPLLHGDPIPLAPRGRHKGHVNRSRQLTTLLNPGSGLDRYQIQDKLPPGNVGHVSHAYDPCTKDHVAIKLLHDEFAEDEHLAHCFISEATHMHDLKHVNILDIREISPRPGIPYFVMSYAERGNLCDLVKKKRRLPFDAALSIAMQIALGLTYAHKRGIIHGDLKPSNILISKHGRVLIADFGLVRSMFYHLERNVMLAKPRMEPAFMSPGVLQGEMEDTRRDIYAFGALLYYMLSGRPPYRGGSGRAVARRVVNRLPRVLGVSRANSMLAAVAEGAMARTLHDRYAVMDDVVKDLEAIAANKKPLGPHGDLKYRQQNASLLWTAEITLLALIFIIQVAHISLFKYNVKDLVQSLAGRTNISARSTSPANLPPLPAKLNQGQAIQGSLQVINPYVKVPLTDIRVPLFEQRKYQLYQQNRRYYVLLIYDHRAPGNARVCAIPLQDTAGRPTAHVSQDSRTIQLVRSLHTVSGWLELRRGEKLMVDRLTDDAYRAILQTSRRLPRILVPKKTAGIVFVAR